MNYYTEEETAITNDQNDNQLLKQFAEKYKTLKGKFENQEKQKQQLNYHIVTLKEENKMLKQEINTLKNSMKERQIGKLTAQSSNIDRGYFTMPTNTSLLSPYHANKTMDIDRSMNLQHTKRRVIKGFVADLALELEQSEELLRKQRKMLEQTRHTLTLCNEQLIELRNVCKNMDSQISILLFETKQLRQQNQRERNQKLIIQRQLNETLVRLQKKSMSYINYSQFDHELSKMDQLYRNIEMQLSYSA